MKQLHVLLFLNQFPEALPEYWVSLDWLRKRFRLYLTVINNGVVRSLSRFMAELPLSYRSLNYALNYHPAQIFAQLTPQALRADTVLWLDADLLWDPARLLEWLPLLEQWTVIHPDFQTVDRPVRHLQADGPLQLQTSQIRTVPPCFCFAREQLAAAQAWLKPTGQMPIVLVGCDLGSRAYSRHSLDMGALAELPALAWAEAEARWAEVKQNPHSDPRTLALLQSLQRAFPRSPQLYQALARQATTPLALLEALAPVLHYSLFQPELLAELCLALAALGQTTEAIQIKDYLDQRFPSYRLPESSWAAQVLEAPLALPAFAFPRAAGLSGVVLLQEAEALSALSPMLADFGDLVSQWVIVSPFAEHEALVSGQFRQGALMWLQVEDCQDLSTLKNYGLAEAKEEWVLVLEQPVRLPRKSAQFLRIFLLQNPAGFCFYAPRLQVFDSHCAQHYLQWLFCLFPRDPSLNFQGGVVSQLCSTSESLTYRHLPQMVFEMTYHNFEPAVILKALQTAGDAALLYLRLAQAYALRGDYDQAEAAYQRAYALESPQSLGAWTALRRLDTLLHLKVWEEAEAWLHTLTPFSQDIPDYWYYKGLLAEARSDYPQAIHAFETCCDFQPRAELLQGEYTLEFLELAPLLRLKDLYWQRALDPSLEIGLHQERLTRLRRILFQLLKYYPSGEAAPNELNLFYFLVQVCIVSVFYQPSQRLLPLFDQALPNDLGDRAQVFYARTALLLLEKKKTALRDRLPPQTGPEEIRELIHNPYYLHLFSKKLWQMPEVDGPEMARAFLSAATVYYRDISYALLLSGLLYNSQAQQEAFYHLKNTSQLFPKNAYLLHHLGRLAYELGQAEEAQSYLEMAVILEPDFVEAQKTLALVQKPQN